MARFACLGSLLACALVLGCGSTTTPGTDDSGRGVDSGVRVDGAGTDSGSTTDTDSGSSTDTDSGSSTDTDSGSTTRTDAGGGTGVSCGSATCGSGEICCVTRGPGGMMVSETCTAPGDCAGATVSCDGPEDCASGEACCSSFSAGGSGGAMCQAEAMCRFGRLCHADGDCTGGDTCCAFMGLMVCSPRCLTP